MASSSPQRVVVAGGGIAGAEALLALRALAGDACELVLVSEADELVLPALAVAEPFALGRAERHPLGPLLERAGAEQLRASLSAVDAVAAEIQLSDGRTLGFDALVLAVGARAVARVQHATTWWPGGNAEEFGGLLRDLEEGYSKRVAFVIPPGSVWPLPVYELALMTAREVAGMGMDGTQLTVVTPEAVPLSLFGAAASAAVAEELRAAGVALEVATVARVQAGEPLSIVLQPSTRRLDVDRVVAIPEVQGPRIPGTAHNAAGFIRVAPGGQMLGADRVWAVGDAIAYPVKFGGLASQQADGAAAEIAARLLGRPRPAPPRLRLEGVLMTGGRPRPLAGDASDRDGERHPVWRPEVKVFGRYLTPFLRGDAPDPEPSSLAGETVIDRVLPPPGESETLHALWHADQPSEEYLRHLGADMHEYEQRLRQSERLLREHGHPPPED